MTKCGYALVLLVVAAAGAAAAIAWCSPILTTDTCCRYAPMAEAFAAGEWSAAFHPRFGFGMPVIAGTFRYLTGADGYVSCAVVASVAWALSIIPLFLLSRRVFDERTAWFAVFLYLLAPTIPRWGFMGLREPFKILGILLAVDAAFGCRDGRWGNLVEASLGLILLFYFKVDAVVFGLLFVPVYLWLDGFRCRGRILFGEAALLLQPCCLLVYQWTGMWVPVVQYVSIIQRCFGG